MFTLTKIEDFISKLSGYALIIDARSPKEFEESKITGASNYFALNNEEHKEVGTIYKQESSAKAKVLGASYICQNSSKHLLEIFKSFPLGSKIGIYCARGGLRSSSLGIILSGTDYKVEKLDGGYKAYRRYVLDYLESFPHKNFISLYGNTGCGKSELIERLETSIDLEELAQHYGSTFGSFKGVQPSQKEFQNQIFSKLQGFSEEEWIFVEAESKKIGSLIQPELFFQRTHEAKCILVTAPIEERVKRILHYYEDISEEFFLKCMNHIKPYMKKSSHQETLDAFSRQDLFSVAQILLEDYYDTVYKKPAKVDFTLHVKDLESALDELNQIKKSLKNNQ